MRFKIEDQEFGLYFSYGEGDIVWSGLQIAVPKTSCYVKHFAEGDKEGVTIGEGDAYCGPLDQFVKKEGRKVALAKAIEDFPREVRRDIWSHYRSVARV